VASALLLAGAASFGARAEAPAGSLYARVLDEGDRVLFECCADSDLRFDQALSKQAPPATAQSLHARNDGSPWKLAATPLSGGRVLARRNGTLARRNGTLARRNGRTCAHLAPALR
jgi:hypothetical protein